MDAPNVHKHGQWTYFAHAHMRHGPHVDPPTFGDVPEANVFISEHDRFNADNRKFWNECRDMDNRRKCGYSMGSIGFTLNGIDRRMFMCPTAMDVIMAQHRHGDFYMEYIQAIADIEGEPIDIQWGERIERWRLSYYYEEVISWGFNNRLSNKVTADAFIQLLHMGRWSDGKHYHEMNYAGKLLEAIGMTKGSDPIKKCAKVFQEPASLGELLRAIANEQLKPTY